MILPIITYGNNILRESCIDVHKETHESDALTENLWDTLNSSGGVGLAAPQINSNCKVFVVNSILGYNELEGSLRDAVFSGDKGIKETFINAQIIDKSEEVWSDFEGCLSIPVIAYPVERAWDITIKYRDKYFNHKTKNFSGYTAKIIQHEYDHTKGILFTDHLSASKRNSLDRKLKRIIDLHIVTNH